MQEVVWGVLTILIGWVFVFITTALFGRGYETNIAFPIALSIIYLSGVVVFCVSRILRKMEQ